VCVGLVSYSTLHTKRLVCIGVCCLGAVDEAGIEQDGYWAGGYWFFFLTPFASGFSGYFERFFCHSHVDFSAINETHRMLREFV